MRYFGIFFVGATLTLSLTADAGGDKAKTKIAREVASQVCVEEAKESANKAFKKVNPRDKNSYDVLARLEKKSSGLVVYVVDIVDQTSDGASSTDFNVASYRVNVRLKGAECNVEDPIILTK